MLLRLNNVVTYRVFERAVGVPLKLCQVNADEPTGAINISAAWAASLSNLAGNACAKRRRFFYGGMLAQSPNFTQPASNDGSV